MSFPLAGKTPFLLPTLPFESVRMVLSMATTKFAGVSIGACTIPQPCWDPLSERRIQVMVIDISRAHFNAKTQVRGV